MSKWVVRMATDWANIDKAKITKLTAYCRSNNLGMGATTDLHGDSGCIWRLCVSYFNLNKITHCFKYPSWRFDNLINHPGKTKYHIKKVRANFLHNNFSHVSVYVPGIRLIMIFLSQYNPT